MMPSNSPALNETSSNTVEPWVWGTLAVTLTSILLVCAAILVGLIIACTLRRRRRIKGRRKHPLAVLIQQNSQLHDIDNPVYSNGTSNEDLEASVSQLSVQVTRCAVKEEEKEEDENKKIVGTYNLLPDQDYENDGNEGKNKDYDNNSSGRGSPDIEREFINPLYVDNSLPSPTILGSSCSKTTNENGYSYAHTTEHRTREDSSKITEDNTYSPLIHYAKANGSSECFSEEVYWAPATDITGLYQQLENHDFREIEREEISINETLGEGQSGVVCRGTWSGCKGELTVAIKTMRENRGKDKDRERIRFLQEAAISGQFRHPNVVWLYGVVTVGEPLMMVLEYLMNGDLHTFLNSLNKSKDSQDRSHLCLSFCQHVVTGMEYLSQKKFVHRDLAARNILVSKDNICKIADFGMARDVEQDDYYVSHGGKIPTKWTAPEALNFKKFSTASDVWSFGCLMYEIWSLGHKPFEGYTNSEVVELVGEGCRLSPPPGCPRAVYKMMMDCWNPEKTQRPSFSVLMLAFTQDSRALLDWSEKDWSVHPKALVIGAPLKFGKHLYSDIQELYITQ